MWGVRALQVRQVLAGRWKLIYTSNTQTLLLLSAIRALPLVDVGDLTQVIDPQGLSAHNQVRAQRRRRRERGQPACTWRFLQRSVTVCMCTDAIHPCATRPDGMLLLLLLLCIAWCMPQALASADKQGWIGEGWAQQRQVAPPPNKPPSMCMRPAHGATLAPPARGVLA